MFQEFHRKINCKNVNTLAFCHFQAKLASLGILTALQKNIYSEHFNENRSNNVKHRKLNQYL
jgi:hypothetical protein